MRSMLGANCAALMVFGMLAVTTTASAQGSAPVVSNVVAQQIPGTGNVRVTYDVSDADGDSVTVIVVFSSNNGAAYDLFPRTIGGDINKRIPPGAGKVITWQASLDYPGVFYPQVVAKVIAYEGALSSSEMVLVPGGEFPFGRSATSSLYVASFMIDKFEVTNGDYERFIKAGGYANPAWWSRVGWGKRVEYGWTAPHAWNEAGSYVGENYPGFPVSGVSWYEAEAYANFVGKRLPTEAEWEKACFGGIRRVYAWGDTLDPRRANYEGSGIEVRPQPVGYFNGSLYQGTIQTRDSPSPYGVYDLMGNVAEWMQDLGDSANYLNRYPDVIPLPFPDAPAVRRMVRGGSFIHGPEYMPSRYQQFVVSPSSNQGIQAGQWYAGRKWAETRYTHVGFRLARSVVD